MPPKARDKGKQKATTAEVKSEVKSEITDEFDFTGLAGHLPIEAEEEEEVVPQELDEESDDDNDSLDQWMQDDNEYIEDDEINNLLNSTTESRRKLKTGGLDEFQRDMEEFDNNLALTSGVGKVKGATKRRIMAGEVRLSEEVKRQLGEANALYISRDYGSAIDILQQIIKDHPNAHPAWNTLGLVHEELGNKEKSLQLRMVAAHMCNDGHLWKELAQKSIENKATKQAIYCFTKALVIDPADVDALWDRSFLYKQLDRSPDAIEGFTKILEYMPHHFKVINELAQLYRAQGKTKEAIKMYEDAIVYHTNNADEEEEEDENEEEDEFSDKLGYSEINMLSELYLILNDYRRSLDTIKTGLRFVQKRQNETWWVDRADDDDEYLEEDESRTDFPIELRVRMGICRVYLNQVEIASQHFQYLLQYPATTYPDLHQDIAYAYYDKRHYELALTVFQKIIDVSDEVEVDILIKTADCYRETGELETAVVFYVNVMHEQPENLDVLMSLATVYEEQGKEEQALELVDFVMQKNREIRKQKRAESSKNNEEDEDMTAAEKLSQVKEARKAKSKKSSLFDEQHRAPMSTAEYYRRRREEMQRRDEEMSYSTLGLFNKLDELDKHIGDSIVDLDGALMRDYMRSAQELWEDFSNTGAFYPAQRSTRFQGFYALRRGKRFRSRDNINLEARHMANRLRSRVKQEDGEPVDMDEDERHMMEEEERNIHMIESTHFRNIPFDKWLRVIIKYAYMLSLTKRSNDAFEVLKRAVEANVFYHDIPKKTALKIATIGCGMVSKQEYIVQEGARWLCNFYQFRNDPYRIYAAVVGAGSKDSHVYANYNHLKYLNRNIKLMDALVANKRKEGGTKDTSLEEIRELNDAILAMNVDPSTANELNYNRFYHIPESVKSRKIMKMGIEQPTQVNPILLSLFGHMMNLTKNHLAGSLFFMRAYAVAPKDRLNTLSLGLALLHVAIQRKVENRHMQIMQGMMFVFEYVKLSGYNQESEYNTARAFHLLGLTHLAVPHYEKVLSMPPKSMQHTKQERHVDTVYKWPLTEEEEEELEQELDDDSDLKREAAYNLHLIYVTSGSMNLAQILMMKYCTI